MQRENSLHALTIRDTPNGERFVKSASFTADHHAGKYLDSFFIAFDNARVNTHAIADRKRRQIGFLLFFLDDVDDGIHKPAAAWLRAHTLIRRRRFCNSNSCGSGSSRIPRTTRDYE